MNSIFPEREQLHIAQGLEAIVTLTERSDFPQPYTTENIGNYLHKLSIEEPSFHRVFYNDMRAYALAVRERVESLKQYYPLHFKGRLWAMAALPAYLAFYLGKQMEKITNGFIKAEIGQGLILSVAGYYVFKIEAEMYTTAKIMQTYLLGSLAALWGPAIFWEMKRREESENFPYYLILQDRVDSVHTMERRKLAILACHYFRASAERELAQLPPSQAEKRKALEEDLKLFKL